MPLPPKKKTVTQVSSEHAEQVHLFTWIRMFEVRHPKLKTIFAIPNGGYRTVTTAGKINDVEYAGMWIEMKVGRNKLTDNQVIFKETLQQYGASYNWAVCYCWTDAAKLIASYIGMEEDLWLKP